MWWTGCLRRVKRFLRVLSHMVMIWKCLPSLRSNPLQRQRNCGSAMFSAALGIEGFCQRWFSSIWRGSDSSWYNIIIIPNTPLIFLWNSTKPVPWGHLTDSPPHRQQPRCLFPAVQIWSICSRITEMHLIAEASMRLSGETLVSFCSYGYFLVN